MIDDHSEEHLARLIASLPPAPSAWVAAAQELPAARTVIDDLVSRSIAHADQREAILGDLESALLEAGVEPRREIVDELRSRLSDPGDAGAS